MHNSRPVQTTFSMIAMAAIASAITFASCGGAATDKGSNLGTPKAPEPTHAAAPEQPAYPADFLTAADITLGQIDQDKVAKGKKIFDEKCHVCHGLTDQKVVGPGWKGVTKERKPEWIMNMILHTQWMLENDTAAQNLVELTKARMTDQQLTKEQARAMLELMRTL